MITVFV